MPGQDSGEEERQRVGEENRQEAKKNYSIALIQEGKKKIGENKSITNSNEITTFNLLFFLFL